MPLSVTHTFVAGTKAKASEVNTNFEDAEDYTSAIPVADLADGSSGQLIVCNSSGVPTYRTVTGPVSVSDAGATVIRSHSAAASSGLASITTQADIPGATVTITDAGIYKVDGVFDFQVAATGAAPATVQALGHLVVNGVTEAKAANLMIEPPSVALAPSSRATVYQWWVVTVGASQVVKLAASKSTTGGGGTATAFSGHTGLVAVRLG